MARSGREEVHTGFWWGNLREKDLLGRPRCRWEDNIKVYVKKIVREGVKCIDLTKNGDRQWVLVNTVVNFRIP